MPFPATTGVILPEDFDHVVYGVFTAILREPWFTSCPGRREQFALFVLDSFRQGCWDAATLHQRCLKEAESRFGDGGVQRIEPLHHSDQLSAGSPS
jgi:hypothetical protein